MARPYTPEEVEELRREIESSLPKSEEEKRRWLIFNGGERFNLESIMREIEREEEVEEIVERRESKDGRLSTLDSRLSTHNDRVWIVEGVLKADIYALKLGEPVIGRGI